MDILITTSQILVTIGWTLGYLYGYSSSKNSLNPGLMYWYSAGLTIYIIAQLFFGENMIRISNVFIVLFSAVQIFSCFNKKNWIGFVTFVIIALGQGAMFLLSFA